MPRPPEILTSCLGWGPTVAVPVKASGDGSAQPGELLVDRNGDTHEKTWGTSLT